MRVMGAAVSYRPCAQGYMAYIVPVGPLMFPLAIVYIYIYSYVNRKPALCSKWLENPSDQYKNMADFFNVYKHSAKQGATSRWLKMCMLYKAGQHTAYGDSQYTTDYADASS